jgi:hypothetical protein
MPAWQKLRDKQIAFFYTMAARFNQKKKKESYYRANLNKLFRGKLQKYVNFVLVI